MANFIESLPTWDNSGTKPNDEVIGSGWKVKDRPPAAWFNWHWHQTYKCLEELRDYLDNQVASKRNIPLLNTTYNNSVYEIATEGSPATAYENGMVMNIFIVSDSTTSPIYIDLDELGNKQIFVEGTAAGRRTFRANRIYTVVYSAAQNGFVVMNVVNRMDKPAIFIGNMNNATYTGRFVAAATDLTNGPSSVLTGMLQDVFLVNTTEIMGYSNQLAFLQDCFSIYSGATYQRTIDSSGAELTQWKENTGSSFKTSINFDDLFSDMIGSGLVTAIDITAGTITVNPGYFYSAKHGLVRILSSKVLTHPAPNGTYYLNADKAGNLTIDTTTPTEKVAIYSWDKTSPTTSTNVSRLVTPIKFKSTMQATTQPLGTNNDTIATTAFVTNAAGAKVTVINFTLNLSTSWLGSSPPYYQNVSNSNIQSSDTPFVDVNLSTTLATALEQEKGWLNVSRVQANSGQLTFYCNKNKPTVVIPVKVKVVR